VAELDDDGDPDDLIDGLPDFTDGDMVDPADDLELPDIVLVLGLIDLDPDVLGYIEFAPDRLPDERGDGFLSIIPLVPR
jgi:hypothetical protein